jgi:alpha-glucosidase (family GH31 glycosyl hydrolase)
VKKSKKLLEIDTGRLHLIYHITRKGFTPENLSITVKETGKTWRFGDSPRHAQNLEGTARTLDEAKGAVHLEPGLVSRAGWALVNDSQTLVFNQDGWLEPREHPGALDLYFFGYGHDYPGCLQGFSQVAGQVPLLPRWILGNWWSRYWPYTQDELLDLMNEFRQRQVPLSVCIVDMDWHITQTGNRSSGWTELHLGSDSFRIQKDCPPAMIWV